MKRILSVSKKIRITDLLFVFKTKYLSLKGPDDLFLKRLINVLTCYYHNLLIKGLQFIFWFVLRGFPASCVRKSVEIGFPGEQTKPVK